MKKLVFFLTFLSSLMVAEAQVSESYATRKKLDSMIYDNLREKLVSLALEHPEVTMNEGQMAIADNNLSKAKWSWANYLAFKLT